MSNKPMRTFTANYVDEFDDNDSDYKGAKYPVNFSIRTLNLFLAYATTNDHENVTRGNLLNMRSLFNRIDDKFYKKNHSLFARFKFIKRALKNRLDEYIDDRELVLENCRSRKFEDIADDIIDDIVDKKLSPNELRFVSKTIQEKLSYIFMYSYSDELITLCTKIQSGDYEDFSKVTKKMKKVASTLLNDIRKVDLLETGNETFSLDTEIFSSVIAKTVNKLSNPSNRLKCGIRRLNKILGGGFETTRFYLFTGLSGGFKSGTLLNLAYQIKMCNQEYKTKTEGKLPTVILLTQENTVEETIERLYSLAVAKSRKDQLKDKTPEEAIELLKKKGKLMITDENNIDLYITYRPGNSINVNDIDNLIQDLEDNGREVICLLHDYILKLRPTRETRELRTDLTNVVIDLKTLAIQRNMPVISLAQLNRESAKIIDSNMECEKTDLARFIGVSNIGESWGVIQESDFVCLINRENLISTNQSYLTFKALKIRFNSDIMDNKETYFNHPFEPNMMQLTIDELMESSVSINSLSEAVAYAVPDESKIIDFNKSRRKNAMEREELSFVCGDYSNNSDLESLNKQFVV